MSKKTRDAWVFGLIWQISVKIGSSLTLKFWIPMSGRNAESVQRVPLSIRKQLNYRCNKLVEWETFASNSRFLKVWLGSIVPAGYQTKATLKNEKCPSEPWTYFLRFADFFCLFVCFWYDWSDCGLMWSVYLVRTSLREWRMVYAAHLERSQTLCHCWDRVPSSVPILPQVAQVCSSRLCSPLAVTGTSFYC